LEILFGLSTALTYRRLGNENHPLRQQLQREARGTSNHSRLVADLASDAASLLGADETLANLGGIFHDIGKLAAPGMFIENISDPDENNPHLDMPPEERVKIILAHVYEGVELARKHNLPSDIIDIISQHHGDTSARFFMEKARKELPPGGELNESAFHYEGPIPQTIEAALVMLADSVSSAVKGLGNEATSEQRAAVITRIIQEKTDEGQFDDCKLTSPMRTRVAHIFMDQLSKTDERVKNYPHGK
ncbi:MAG: HDIG domain-containing protein, partial [bacterium]|nr:HDIG domain-containing protein [bacterium]